MTLVSVCITFLKTGIGLIPCSPFPREGNQFVGKPPQCSQGAPSELTDGPGGGLNSQRKCQPSAFYSGQRQREKKTTRNLTSQTTCTRELKTLTRATSALWLNIESAELSQKGDYYKEDAMAAALPHAYVHLLSTLERLN